MPKYYTADGYTMLAWRVNEDNSVDVNIAGGGPSEKWVPSTYPNGDELLAEGDMREIPLPAGTLP